MEEQILVFRKRLKAKLDSKRYEHSLSVSFTCMALAMRYGYNLQKAELAGLLHDCGKRYSEEELIQKCEKHGVPLTEAELLAPMVIHAKYGAFMVRNKFGIEDEEILSAIACHTTGKPDMSLLDKILYVADYIEPRRDQAAYLSELRVKAFENLDQTICEMLQSSLIYLEKKGIFVHPVTRETLEYYQQQPPIGESLERRTSNGMFKRIGETGGSRTGRKKRRGYSHY